MTYEEMRIKESATKEMNRRFPYKEVEYRNSIVATIIGLGKNDKLTEDWVRRGLLTDVEDGFITYGQAITIKDEYFKAIKEVERMF